MILLKRGHPFSSRLIIGSDHYSVTLGLSRYRSAARIKGNQATFDHSQRNNLRSCVWVSAVVFLVRMFVLQFCRPGLETSSL